MVNNKYQKLQANTTITTQYWNGKELNDQK